VRRLLCVATQCYGCFAFQSHIQMIQNDAGWRNYSTGGTQHGAIVNYSSMVQSRPMWEFTSFYLLHVLVSHAHSVSTP